MSIDKRLGTKSCSVITKVLQASSHARIFNMGNDEAFHRYVLSHERQPSFPLTMRCVVYLPDMRYVFPTTIFSCQQTRKMVMWTLGNIIRTNTCGYLSDQDDPHGGPLLPADIIEDEDVVAWAQLNAKRLAELGVPKTTVVVSNPPFNSRGFARFGTFIKECPLADSKWYNCPAFGVLAQILAIVEHPCVSTKVDAFVSGRAKDRPNKMDYLKTYIEINFSGTPWVASVVGRLDKFNAYIRANIPDTTVSASEWQEQLRSHNDFSIDHFQDQSHCALMAMLGVPQEAHQKMLSECKREWEWLGKFCSIAGANGCAADILNLSMYLAGIEPENACLKTSDDRGAGGMTTGGLVKVARSILDNGAHITDCVQERLDDIGVIVGDLEVDDMAEASLVWHHTQRGSLQLVCQCTAPIYYALTGPGGPASVLRGNNILHQEGGGVRCVSLTCIKDPDSDNNSAAMPVVKEGLERWFSCWDLYGGPPPTVEEVD
jgi:hypothetical protein